MRNRLRLLLVLTGLVACGGGKHASTHPGTGQDTPDASIPDSCKGKDIEQSGTLDIDVKALSIDGTVTLNGGAVPDGARGLLSFVETSSGAIVSAPIETSGPSTYGLVLAPGTYDIRYDGDASACQEPASAVPCNGGVLKSKVKLSTDGSLDLDVPTVRVSGSVTLDGAAFPPQSRAYVTFAAGTDSAYAPIGEDGSYRIVLVAGTYDAGYGGPSNRCGESASVPCNQAVLKKGVGLTKTGALDLDVKSVQVSGAVTLNGAPFPSGDSGTIAFAPAGTDGGVGVEIGSGAQYGLTLVAGTYDVSYGGASSSCNDRGQSPTVP